MYSLSLLMALSELTAVCKMHSVKSVCIRSYSGPHLPAFGPQ